MNKELEEAIKWFKNNIRYYEEQVEYINKIDSDYYDEEKDLYLKRIEIFKNILNYIENSISKEVIEEILDYDKSNYINFIKVNSKREAIQDYIEYLKQELLEVK